MPLIYIHIPAVCSACDFCHILSCNVTITPSYLGAYILSVSILYQFARMKLNWNRYILWFTCRYGTVSMLTRWQFNTHPHWSGFQNFTNCYDLGPCSCTCVDSHNACLPHPLTSLKKTLMVLFSKISHIFLKIPLSKHVSCTFCMNQSN